MSPDRTGAGGRYDIRKRSGPGSRLNPWASPMLHIANDPLPEPGRSPS